MSVYARIRIQTTWYVKCRMQSGDRVLSYVVYSLSEILGCITRWKRVLDIQLIKILALN